MKIKIFHFHNGSGGGVLSVIKNLIKFSTNEQIENHIIYTINPTLIPDFQMPAVENVISQQVFYYNSKNNFYHTCKCLAKLLPDEKSIIVAHDWLELGMMSNLGLQNPVVHFLHGDYEYYYDLAKKHGPVTDRFITVSPVIYNKLTLSLPHRKADILYCRFPVPSIQSIIKNNTILKLFYCVRSLTDVNKQFRLLPLINEKLKSQGTTVHWTIIGDEMSKAEVENVMDQHANITLFPSLTNEEVTRLMPGHDLFILPSLLEGFPVAVVEAMKAGLVPLVTNWEGATEELIINGKTGYYFETGDAEAYANNIVLLNNDRKLMKQLAANAEQKANELFDPYVNTKNIESVISKASYDKKQKRSAKVYGSILDQLWMPNFITKTIRSCRK